MEPVTHLDPISAEVIRHSLRAITDELETNLTRTAFSPLIYEYKDFAVGIVAADGRLICQGPGGLPIFLADLGGPLRSVLEHHPLAGLAPGDALITNDPAACGQHLNNVNMYLPVFFDGCPVAFVGVRAHWTDVGGMALGSSLQNISTDIHQEGVLFPALKVCRAGVVDQDILRLITTNSRLPEMVGGDVSAQLGACRLGERRLLELEARFGWAAIRSVIAESWKRTEDLARRRIAELPDGEYDAESWLDNDGVDLDRPVSVKVRVIVHGDSVTVDLSGVSPQVRGPYNSGYNGGGLTAAKVAYKYAVIPDVPADEGCFRPLDLVLPSGTMVSARPAAPMARWNLPMSTVIDTILRAFSQAAPRNVPAGHHAAQNSFQFVGRRADGRPWQYHDTAHGGWGASLDADGSGPFKTLSHGDCRDLPTEIVEALYPVRIEAVELRQDSGGPGRHRGGMGLVRRCRTLAPCQLTVNFERTSCPPWGLQGGGPAQVGYVEVELPDGSVDRHTKATALPLPAGALVTLVTAGGGGHGDPLARDRDKVAADVRLGYVSAEAARREYGGGADG